jgi:hypothetical protein
MNMDTLQMEQPEDPLHYSRWADGLQPLHQLMPGYIHASPGHHQEGWASHVLSLRAPGAEPRALLAVARPAAGCTRPWP